MELGIGSIDSPVEKTQEEQEEGDGDIQTTGCHVECIWKTHKPVHGDVYDLQNPLDGGLLCEYEDQAKHWSTHIPKIIQG